VDITQLIQDDHHEQRRLFAILEEIDSKDEESLAAVWSRLKALLDTHAEAEERFFYPSLTRQGKGAGGKPDAAAETLDAIKDHNEIRDAGAEVDKHPVGSKAWREALAAANKANGEHMDEEERQGLADARANLPREERHRLAVAFAAFEAVHITGVTPVDKSPEAYVAAQQAPRRA
jgi:hypothetical protein